MGLVLFAEGKYNKSITFFMGSKQIIDPTGTKQTSSFDFVPRVTISSTLTAGTIFERKVNNILRKYWQTKKYSYNTRALILNILFMAKILNPLPGEREENVRSFGSLFQKIKEMEEIFPGEGKRLGKFFATGYNFALADCRKISESKIDLVYRELKKLPKTESPQNNRDTLFRVLKKQGISEEETVLIAQILLKDC